MAGFPAGTDCYTKINVEQARREIAKDISIRTSNVLAGGLGSDPKGKIVETYQLTIEIDKVGRERMLQFNEQVVLVKMFDDPAKDLVVWIAFAPFGQENIVQFTSDYSVYASEQQMVVDTTIRMMISQQATTGNLYTLDNTGFDSGKENVPDEYGVNNQHQGLTEITVGLAQKIIKPNNEEPIAPINIAVVPYNQTIYFKPIEKILVFVASAMQDGLILPQEIINSNTESPSFRSEPIVGQALTVDFTSVSSETIHYNNTTNTFILGGLSS